VTFDASRVEKGEWDAAHEVANAACETIARDAAQSG